MAMKKIILGFTLALTLGSQVFAQNVIIPAPPELAASAYILMDADSGEILVAKNEHEPLPPASLVKLMTSFVAEQELQAGRIHWDETTRVSVRAWRTGGSRMFIQESTNVSIGDLLKGIIIVSGNDASVAMAEHIAGTEEAFAGMMNQVADSIGMRNTNFTNSTGLPDDNLFSTAYDMAILSQAIIQQSPEYYPIYAEQSFTYNDITQNNRNLLLRRNPDVDGLKTGHTSAAGYCLAASALTDGMRLIAVVMGSASDESRTQEVQTLLSYGFRYFKTHQLYEADQSLDDFTVWGGDQGAVTLGIEDKLFVTIPRGSENHLQAVVNVPPVLRAPIAEGEEVGQLVVMNGDEVIAERPVIAMTEVTEAGFFGRLWDSVRLFFWKMFN